MKTIVLASRNRDKIEEMHSILSELGIDLKSALDFPKLQEVVEDADTLEGNALKKARYVHRMTDLPALADDTGLEVDALNGAPGVYTARYAGEEASYADNVDKLLRELKNRPERGAQFRTAVAFVDGKQEQTFEGICRGEITRERSGDGGFGYDPVFRPEGYEQTFAELDSDVKNRISHRGKAIQQFLNWLKQDA